MSVDEVKRRDPSLPVIVFSGHGNLDTAVAAVRRGAMDFIEKPFESERLLHLVARATETERLRRENATLRAGFLSTNMSMMTKPFSLDELANRISDLIAQRAALA